jgi:hypothetical protein
VLARPEYRKDNNDSGRTRGVLGSGLLAPSVMPMVACGDGSSGGVGGDPKSSSGGGDSIAEVVDGCGVATW